MKQAEINEQKEYILKMFRDSRINELKNPSRPRIAQQLGISISTLSGRIKELIAEGKIVPIEKDIEYLSRKMTKDIKEMESPVFMQRPDGSYRPIKGFEVVQGAIQAY